MKKKLILIEVVLMLGLCLFGTVGQTRAASSNVTLELIGPPPIKENPKIPNQHQQVPSGIQSTSSGKLPQTGVTQQGAKLSWMGIGLLLISLLGFKKQYNK